MTASSLAHPGTDHTQHVQQPPMLITTSQCQKRHAVNTNYCTVGPEQIYKNKTGVMLNMSHCQITRSNHKMTNGAALVTECANASTEIHTVSNKPADMISSRFPGVSRRHYYHNPIEFAVFLNH